MFGFLNINKPSGPTSHDIVASLRKVTGERRIGHAGTLDPLASGVLVVALGVATRLLEYVMASEKEYLATIRLGVKTDTYDTTGRTVEECEVSASVLNRIDEVVAGFIGPQMQRPPVYSAIKVGGKTSYARARAGETVELEARPITVYDVAIEKVELPLLTIRVRCSAGTYIRSIAHDIGIELGCGGALESLCRTASGNFRVDEALEWETVPAMSQSGTLEGHLMTPAQAISSMDSVQLDAENLRHVLSGRAIPGSTGMARLGQAYAPDGRFVGILKSDIDHCVWKPCKVFPTLV